MLGRVRFIAVYLLSAIGGGVARRGGGPIAQALAIWNERWKGDTSTHAMVLRDRLVNSWIRCEAFSMTNQRAAQVRRAGTPGPEGSVGKLAFAEENQRVYDLCVDLMGNDGMLFPAGYPMIRPDLVGMSNPDARKMFLRVRANSIEGGTSEVMRNILAERVLGLPGDVRNDKALPWKDVPVAHAATDKGHGRITTRTIQVLPAPDGLPFPHVSQVFLIERYVTDLQGKPVSAVAALGVASPEPAQAGPADLARYVREQWSIESLHWIRDTLYQEDKSQVRTRSGPRAMAALRNLAVGALRIAGRADITEATRWAARSMDRPFTILGLT